jgi:ABC-type transport system substrate-binding protein
MYGIPRQEIIESVLHGYAKLSERTPRPEGNEQPPSVTYPYDPEKAKELLEARGLGDGGSATIRLVFSPQAIDPSIVTQIVDAWQQIGVSVDVRSLDSLDRGELDNAVRNCEFDVLMTDVTLPERTGFEDAVFATNGSLNFSGPFSAITLCFSSGPLQRAQPTR